jgi:TRAP transporter TAXI family solute receptor
MQASAPSTRGAGRRIGCRGRLRASGRCAVGHGDRLAIAGSARRFFSFIPGGLYAGNPENVPTFGSQAVLVASSNQPDELAYGLVKAVFENFADFRRLHPALASLDIKQMVPSESVMPIHPGALRYFHEAGLVR